MANSRCAYKMFSRCRVYISIYISVFTPVAAAVFINNMQMICRRETRAAAAAAAPRGTDNLYAYGDGRRAIYC